MGSRVPVVHPHDLSGEFTKKFEIRRDVDMDMNFSIYRKRLVCLNKNTAHTHIEDETGVFYRGLHTILNSKMNRKPDMTTLFALSNRFAITSLRNWKNL